MPNPPTIYKQGDLYWCDPDPKDTQGSEQAGDRIWVIVSMPWVHRGKCVVGLPLSRHIEKAGIGALPTIPKNEITMEDGNPPIDRVALTDQIRALDKTRLRKKAGYVSVRAINTIKLGIEYLIGYNPPSKPSNLR